MHWPALHLLAPLLALAVLAACDAAPPGGDPPGEPPLFGPGDYGGTALAGTEDLYNLVPSPDGTRIALIRRRTPGVPLDPLNQLWIVGADGSDPRFIGPNVGIVQWAPDGRRLAVGVAVQLATFVFTLDLDAMEERQWTGREGDYLSFANAVPGGWFADGRRLLVSVWGLAYQQPYLPGTYVLDTETRDVEGPLLDWMRSAQLGNHEAYVLGRKYVYPDHPEAGRNGNWARHDLATDTWAYITAVPRDSVDFLNIQPSPVGPEAVQAYRVQNADQLSLMQSDGSGVRRITELGGSNPRWSADGVRVFFRRDVHRGPGARWVPMVYEVGTGEERVLWQALPDSVPQFPPVPPPGLHRVRP